ncbi:MAG: NAD-dependent epimerase/dehydratase family protein [Acidimicrobiales bacterium]
MKVFVAGATGVVGTPTVRALIRAGHDVTAIGRSPEKRELLRSLRATPVNVSLFDPDGLKAVVAGHDAVVNLSTHIPPISQAARRSSWAENDRIRTEGAANLVDAALAGGVRRYVQESIAFTYPDGGDGWLDEDTPLDPIPLNESLRAAEASAARFGESGDAVVLRFGAFIAPDSEQTVAALNLARRGIGAQPGPADKYLSSIHADDVATAVVAALHAPPGTYNVVDDEPLTRREYADALGVAVDHRTRLRAPGRLVRMGGRAGALLGRSQRSSNRRFKEATGWAPAYPSAREALAAAAAASEPPPVRPVLERLVRPILALLALTALQLGVWAVANPRSFYDDFPAGPSSWVAVDGPYNEHLVRDFGGLNLALAILLIAAFARPTTYLVGTAALASLFFGVPHLTYHALNVDVYDTGDAVATTVALALAVVGPVVLLVAARRGLRSRS